MTYEPLNEDGNQPATKGDLKDVATKMATKEELKGLHKDMPGIVNKAVKTIIKDEFNEVKKELADWKDEIAGRRGYYTAGCSTAVRSTAGRSTAGLHESSAARRRSVECGYRAPRGPRPSVRQVGPAAGRTGIRGGSL